MIDFNYNQAIQQANGVADIARQLENLSKVKFKNTVETISAYWEGDAARMYLANCEAVKIDIETQAKQLHELSNRMKQVAKIIHEAEEKAKAEVMRKAKQAASGGGGGLGGW